jgi:hypothetical protein
MSQNQLALDLAATKQALADRGRCRQLLMNTEGNVCLDGAVGVACELEMMMPEGNYSALYKSDRAMAVIMALAAQTSSDHQRLFGAVGRDHEHTEAMHIVYYFNDHPNTTDQDCFDLIDKALAEAGGLA